MEFQAKIEEAIESNLRKVDKEASDGLKCSWAILDRAKTIVFDCIGAIPKSDEMKRDSVLILLNCLTDLIDAQAGVRAGFLRGPGMILRGVWENMAVSIAIHENPEKYGKFKEGHFQTTKAVADAKKVVPGFGQSIGAFSNFFVHETYQTIARGLETDGGQVTYSLVPPVKGPKNSLIMLTDIAFCARVAGSVAEYICCHYLQGFYFWKIEDSDMVSVKDTEEDGLLQTLCEKTAAVLDDC